MFKENNTSRFFKCYNSDNELYFDYHKIQSKIAEDYPIFELWKGNSSWMRVRGTNMLISWNDFYHNWYIAADSDNFLKADDYEHDLSVAMRTSKDCFIEKSIEDVIVRIPDPNIKIQLLEALIDLAEKSNDYSP